MLPVWMYPLVTVFVWAAGIWLFLHFFTAFKFVFLAVLAAATLASALAPLRRRMPGPRWLTGALSGLLPIVVGIALLYLVGYLITGPVTEEMQQWPNIRQSLNQLIGDWSRHFGVARVVTVEDMLQQAEQYLFGEGGMSMAATTASTVWTILIALITIAIGHLYMQTEPAARLISPVLKALPPHRRADFQHALDDLAPRLRWWLIGTFIDIIVIGVASWIFYSLAGLPLAVPLAVLTGLSEIVPTIGPTVAFLIALLFAASQGTTTVLWIFGAFAIIHLMESYILMPLVMKRAVHIPPVITMFTVVFWSYIFGVPGLLLALPINLLIWSFADHFLIRRYERGSQTTS